MNNTVTIQTNIDWSGHFVTWTIHTTDGLSYDGRFIWTIM